jgi:hypothetical protein
LPQIAANIYFKSGILPDCERRRSHPEQIPLANGGDLLVFSGETQVLNHFDPREHGISRRKTRV